MSILGTRVIRTEDPRLLTAGGVYVDDLRTPELSGAARVTFVRSPVAHARITGIDTTQASQEPGVIAVLTVADMDDLAPPPPDDGSGGGGGAGPVPRGGVWSEPLLAVDTVRYVGEPVAVVITDGRYQGEDAADLVSVDYDPLPAVVGPAAAVTDEVLLFPAAGTNVPIANPASTDDSPFSGCDVVVEHDIINQRVACMPMEGRATAAAFSGGKLTVWHSSQNAQLCRLILCGALGMAPAQIRVVVPDVGGGFGAKVGIDRDAIIVAWAARKTGRALRWAETRSENLVGMTQGRAQLQHVKIGGSRDGRIQAYRLDIIQDTGAYPRAGGFLPGLTCLMAPGVYDIPEVQAGFRLAVTNATPIHAYRGAGRPEAAAAIERAVDLFAAEIGMDPAEVRRRNFIAPGKFPFQPKTGALYDSGEYEAALDKVLAAAGYPELRQEQERRRADGDVKQLGIGLSTYVEITAADAAAGETAKLEVADADVVLDTVTGLWQVRGDPDTSLSWGQVAGHTSGGSLIADVRFTADLPTFPFGAHVSVVEVDTETGQVTLLRHVTVDDAGPVLNPVLAEGQRHGGIAQGAAQALLEEVLYDADGNPLTSTLADYAAITATELPSFELLASETPTTLNPLGVKGIGEAGTIGATPAIQNAVTDALAHLGIRHIDMPATPQRVWTAINAAQKAGNQ